MSSQTIALEVSKVSVRWLARIGSSLSIGLILLFLVGEPFHPTQIPLKQWIGLIFFPLGVVIGLIIAWWKEGAGAGVTLLSLLAFYGVYGLLLGNHLGGWFIAFAAPAFLFLLYSIILKSKSANVKA